MAAAAAAVVRRTAGTEGQYRLWTSRRRGTRGQARWYRQSDPGPGRLHGGGASVSCSPRLLLQAQHQRLVFLSALLCDLLPTYHRFRCEALIGVTFSIGFTVGHTVGAAFSRWGSTGWFAASAVYARTLTVANIIFFALFFQELLPEPGVNADLRDPPQA
ncbi:uncharacterized protein LOC135114159 isoform X3 [Scylla paramamosain]|uniref:uncharacterized protein LOC135114159 isoform X3 n=1 Tax=Scylla paramamosain TaxID=85552 RepID=UPI003082C3A6